MIEHAAVWVGIFTHIDVVGGVLESYKSRM